MIKKLPFAIVVLALALLAVAGMGVRDIPGLQASAAQTSATVPPTRGGVAGLPDFSVLIQQQGPAVVNINTTRTPIGGGETPGAGTEEERLFEFFKRFGIPMPDGRAVPRQGIGSGFIVSEDGYVITNAHVVADASEVTVTLTNKREFKAKVIGSDQRTDIALLKIDATGLPAVRIGSSEDAKVGEWVAAIGSPFGFDNSITAGIISAKARWIPDGGTYVPFIQTDVAVNPGNSGGPLFNMNGEVIGVNSMIYSRSGGYMGVSFAIPIEAAMKVKEDLQKYGRVTRGKLGVTIQPVTRELAQSFGLDQPIGALVNSVEEGGPADKAGIQAGDIILGVDGEVVKQSFDLPRLIGERSPGKDTRLEIWRRGERKQLQARLGEFAEPQEQVATRRPDAAPGKLGLAVRPLTDEEKRQLGTGGSGMMIENVSGAAARAGLRPGDVVLSINNQPVSTAEQFAKLADSGQGPIALLIQRGDNKIFIPLDRG